MASCFSILAFWSFASAWMLLWALAATLPLLLHWWSKRRYQATKWAAMQFLLAAMQQTARRVALEQWLLLALRIALLLLFAIALAEPLFSWVAPRSPLASDGKTFTLLVLDASISMDYRAADRSRFDAARELARKLVLQGGQGEAFSLLLLADPPQPVIRRPAFDPGDVLEELAAIKLSSSRGDLAATLTQAAEILEAVAQQHPEFTSRRIVFLTDLERATWEEVASTACREQFVQIFRLAAPTLVELGLEETSNVAVTRLEASRALVLPGQPVEFTIGLQAYGDRAVATQVELLIDGNRLREQSLELVPGVPASVRFAHTFASAGEHVVEARVHDPRLLADNARWLAVPVREALRVLCLEGRPREARRLSLALNPEPASDRQIAVVEAADSTLLDQDLFAYDAVCLCNVARFSAEEAQLLSRFVMRGGGLLIFLGDQSQAENYNELLAPPADNPSAPSLLPARLGEPIGGAQYSFDPLEYRHPLLAAFRGHERSGLLTTPVWKYVRLQPLPGAQTALGFVGGDPALVAGKLGSGRTLLFASAVSPQSQDRTRNPPLPWNALDTWPSFPPLAQEMLQYVVTADAATRTLLAGDDMSGHLPAEAVDAFVTIITPSGSGAQAPVRGEEGAWSHRAEEGAGIYQVVQPSTERRELFAVNVETRESELATIDQEQLPQELRSETREHSAAARLEPPRAWFRSFLFAVLALLLLESCVAWRVGR
jgi:hypothetical protein